MSRKELKIELKSMANDIRVNKHGMKDYQRDNNGCQGSFWYSLYKLRYEYRHKHIAYSMLRGRKYEEIESKSTIVRPNFNYIKEIMDAHKEIPQDVCLGA